MKGTTVLFRADATGAAVPLLPVIRTLGSAVEFSELHVFLKDAPSSLFQFEPGVKVHSFSQIAKRNRKEPSHSSLGISRPVETLVDLSLSPSPEGEKLASLLAPGWLAPGSIVSVERPVRHPVVVPPGLSNRWERSFGDTLLTFLFP